MQMPGSISNWSSFRSEWYRPRYLSMPAANVAADGPDADGDDGSDEDVKMGPGTMILGASLRGRVTLSSPLRSLAPAGSQRRPVTVRWTSTGARGGVSCRASP